MAHYDFEKVKEFLSEIGIITAFMENDPKKLFVDAQVNRAREKCSEEFDTIFTRQSENEINFILMCFGMFSKQRSGPVQRKIPDKHFDNTIEYLFDVDQHILSDHDEKIVKQLRTIYEKTNILDKVENAIDVIFNLYGNRPLMKFIQSYEIIRAFSLRPTVYFNIEVNIRLPHDGNDRDPYQQALKSASMCLKFLNNYISKLMKDIGFSDVLEYDFMFQIKIPGYNYETYIYYPEHDRVGLPYQNYNTNGLWFPYKCELERFIHYTKREKIWPCQLYVMLILDILFEFTTLRPRITQFTVFSVLTSYDKKLDNGMTISNMINKTYDEMANRKLPTYSHDIRKSMKELIDKTLPNFKIFVEENGGIANCIDKIYTLIVNIPTPNCYDAFKKCRNTLILPHYPRISFDVSQLLHEGHNAIPTPLSFSQNQQTIQYQNQNTIQYQQTMPNLPIPIQTDNDRKINQIREVCRNVDPVIVSVIIDMMINKRSKSDITEYIMVNIPAETLIDVINLIE